MAYPEQVDFIKSCLIRFPIEFKNLKNILEICSQNINSSIRYYFEGSKYKNCIGLDLGKGKDVDFVIPAELILFPNGLADIPFFTECFENAKKWQDIFLNMISITHKNIFIILAIVDVIGYKNYYALYTSKTKGTRRKMLNLDKIKSLGWEPKISLLQGIESTYEWYKKNEL